MPEQTARTAVALAGSQTVRHGRGWRRVPLRFEEVLEAAAIAEGTGYEAVFVPDHGVWEPFTLLASVASRTARIVLAPGVVTLDGERAERHAAAAATLNRVSGGRAALGLGAGHERRLRVVEERVTAVREGLVDHDVGTPPVFLAALGPRMAELAGAIADGVLLNWCTPERVARARAEVARGAERRGRDPADVVVAVYVRACLGPDEDGALAALREAAAMYAGLPDYLRQFEAMGLGEEAASAAAAGASGRLDLAPESLVRSCCVLGGRQAALERLATYRAAGADLVVVYPVTSREPASSLLGTVMAAAPDPAVER